MDDAAPVSPGELRDRAQAYGSDALEKLKTLMGDAKSSAAIQLSAARAILDRGYGRPASLRTEERDEAPFIVVVENYGDHDPDSAA